LVSLFTCQAKITEYFQMLRILESVIAGFSSFFNEKNIPASSHDYNKKLSV